MARGGRRPGAGRKKGVPNKRTRERLAEFAKSGRTDPLDSALELHEWASREFKRACRELAAFEKKHGKKIAEARILHASSRTPDMHALVDEHDRLNEQVDRFSSKIHAYAMGAAPYLHPRLAATEANLNVTNHEAALDELDEDES